MFNRIKETIRILRGIRDPITLGELQEEQKPWVKHNFGNRPSWYPLLGVVEELGELAHAHLKEEQGIRGTKAEHMEAKKDAVGDIVIFLADYCSAEGIDLQKAVDEAWSEVKKRDWKAHPKTGKSEQEALSELQHYYGRAIYDSKSKPNY